MMKSIDSQDKPPPIRRKGSKDLPVAPKGSRDSAPSNGAAAGSKHNQSKKVIKKISSCRKRAPHPSPSKNSTENVSEEENKDGKGGSGQKPPSKLKTTLTLEPMDEVSSTTNKYIVKRKLGEGGFGAVYQVKAKTKPKNQHTKAFALKTEARGPKSPDRLKIEVAVLIALNNADEKVRERFASMIDRGQTKDFVFIVMSLVGPSLQTIRDNILLKEFSPSTAFKIALESLESIKCLHSEIGYLHRDIKPSNFTIGSTKNFTKIILIDFGIARQLYKNNQLRPPRKEVKFLGTVRFASRRCHKHEDQGRQGDCESWFYMICDIYNQNVLPWRRVREKDLVYALKNDLREHDGNNKCLTEQLPKEFRDIMLCIDKLDYEDVPDYNQLRSFIEHAAKRTNADINARWDWEVYGPPPAQDSDE